MEDERAGVLEQLQNKIELLTAEKNQAYAERNRLVAALARMALDRAPSWDTYGAWLGRHPDTDAGWEKDWMNIVFVRLPTGQLTWHIHDSELPMFSFLSELKAPDGGWPAYDGHTTEEKYERLLWWRP